MNYKQYHLLKHSQISYDEIFKEVNVQEYISHEENLYLFDTKKSLENYEYANVIRKNNKTLNNKLWPKNWVLFETPKLKIIESRNKG